MWGASKRCDTQKYNHTAIATDLQMEASSFHQALYALFGNDPIAQTQANQWLTDFASKPEAWQASLSLLDPSNPSQIAFFCANILLTKARRDWTETSPSDRMAITQQASAQLTALSAAPASAVVSQRLALALAAMAAQSGPPAAAQFVEQALHMAASAVQGGSEVWECGLEVWEGSFR